MVDLNVSDIIHFFTIINLSEKLFQLVYRCHITVIMIVQNMFNIVNK